MRPCIAALDVCMRERTNCGRSCSFSLSFYSYEKTITGKQRTVNDEQIKTCRKKRHVRIDNMKEQSNLICGKFAVGRNYNLTRDSLYLRMIKHNVLQ